MTETGASATGWILDPWPCTGIDEATQRERCALPRVARAGRGRSRVSDADRRCLGHRRVARDLLLRRSVHGGVVGSRSGGRPVRRRSRRDRCAARVRRRRLAADVAGGSSRAAAAARPADRGERGRADAPPDPRERQADQRDAARRDGSRGRLLLLRRPGRDAARDDRPAQRPELRRLHDSRADRRRRGHHPVEHAARAARLEALPGTRRREHGRRQAVRGYADVDPAPGRARRRGRVSAGRRERRHRLRQPDRGGARGAPGRRQDRVHRLDGDGTGDRPRCGRAERTRLARARRQVAAADLRRRRSEQRRRRRHGRRLRRHGPDLHGGLARSRRGRRLRRGRRAARDARAADPPG